MVDPQPATSQQTSEGINPEFKNRMTNKESARFLMRVIQKAEEEIKNSKNNRQFDRTSVFTGVDKRIFENKLPKPDLKLSDIKDIERTQIHEQLLNSYFIGNLIPSTNVLYRALFGQIPSYVDIRTFRKYLASYGYVWLRVPNGFIVIERPSVTFERYFYLRDIIRYRKEKREIFYVDETILCAVSGEYYTVKRYNSLKKAGLKAGKIISQEDLVKNLYAVSRSGLHALGRINEGIDKFHSDEFSQSVFKEWVSNKLLPVLPPKSVVVIKKDKHYEPQKPSLYSIKSEMMEWLDKNNVPYDEKMSKCELMSLIDTYTSEEDGKDEIENLLNCNGHILLQLPFSAETISVAYHVFNLIKLNGPKMDVQKNGWASVFDAVSPKQLEVYDDNISELEKETMEIDMKVDEILDDLIAKMGTQRSQAEWDSEVPLSDSD